ncbi:MAG TPA: hypothetical protein VF773_17000 [Verrucomicrobiae bacterium]
MKREPAMNHETELISSFVVPEKRARYLELLAKPKRRREILDRLNHCFDIMPQFATTSNWRLASELERLLRAKGAGDIAHVIADNSELDGLDLPLFEALDGVLSHQFGSVVSCIPGRLAFYKKEAPGDAFILERKS